MMMFWASFILERRVGFPLAIFGGMVTTAGGKLMFQNIFDLYASWPMPGH